MLSKERINTLKNEWELFENISASINKETGRTRLLTGAIKTEKELSQLQELCRLYKTMFYRYQEVLDLLTEE